VIFVAIKKTLFDVAKGYKKEQIDFNEQARLAYNVQ